ncbi:amino acid deaminase [Phytoactinopolyspora limicola]|uniref:amino acid deaminase n=1 Tax=Phytoactinopolyspora limicola TaxID=2715536 RepID=UPI00140D7691|nr:amino acid deaminase [Phytoactinopolyspora limicola]
MSGTDNWTISWRDKSFPPDAYGLDASRIAAQGWHLGQDFMTPVAALTRDALAHNAARMHAYCSEHDVRIAPHGKTTMSPEMVALQVEHGAWGATAATAWQAQALAGFGVRRVLIANECIDPVGLTMLAGLLRDDPDLEIYAFVDSVAAVEAMCDGLRGALARPFPVLVEVGAAGRRAGARDVDTAVAVGLAVVDAPELELAGVGCFEGVLGGARVPEVVDSVRTFLGMARGTAERLMQMNAFRAGGPVILTGGGSAFFDQVVEVFTADREEYSQPVEVVIRSGCYLTHDHGSYGEASPFAATDDNFRPALHVWSRVISTPEPGLAIIDAGRRDVSFDSRMPVVVARYRGRSYDTADRVPALERVVVDRLNDQHGYLFTPTDQDDVIRTGDHVVLGISHPCTTFDKWRTIPIVDDNHHVVSAARTYF